MRSFKWLRFQMCAPGRWVLHPSKAGFAITELRGAHTTVAFGKKSMQMTCMADTGSDLPSGVHCFSINF